MLANGSFLVAIPSIKESDKLIRIEQVGYQVNRSCADQINTLMIICEQSNEWKSTLYFLFLDFEKALDSLNRDYIWKTLSKFGLPVKNIRMIKLMYEDYTCNLMLNGMLTEDIINSTV